ncbi:MAG: hypothetical protein V7768_13020, partial [Dietzia cercidiphylli]
RGVWGCAFGVRAAILCSGEPVAAEGPLTTPVRGVLLMPVIDFSQLQMFWDGIFPAIFGPLAGLVDTIGASVEGP